ncbi:MAG: hypothetical protein JWO31_3440 [Phycisphaerales bacterium]|nr:hypothetical protein [Phycisphaerales bacterium]
MAEVVDAPAAPTGEPSATGVAVPPVVPVNVAPTKPGQWAVPRPAGVCAVSGRAIAPGERFVAGVRETPAGIERVDVAAEHWPSAGAPSAAAAAAGIDPAGLLASWQTVMPRPEEKKKRFVDDAVLCTLFERLADATEPAKLNFRFVLGLILMRKRLVLYDETRREGDRDVWVVRMRGKPDTLELVDPKLNAEQTLEVSGQLGQVLNEEL